MANEILYSGLGDLRTAEALSAQYLLLLADRQAIPQNHPALVYAGSVTATGSGVLKVPHVGLFGYDLPSSASEGDTSANTALTDGSSTVTPARYTKVYEASDLARMTDPVNGFIKPEVFMQDAMIWANLKLTQLIANLVDNFTMTVGTSGVDATVENFLQAIDALEGNKVEPPYVAVLHPVQWGDIRRDLALASGGAVQWMPASAEAVMAKGIGYQGNLAGVDVYTCSYVPTANANADRAGGMFGRGAIIWGDGDPVPSGRSDEIVIGGKILMVQSRIDKSDLMSWSSHVYLGASKGIDLCGVSIITDA